MCGIFIGEKEKWTNKDMMNMRMMILSNTVQLVVSNVCTKFQITRCNNS